MLHAFLSGKKRGTGVEGERLSEGFAGAEDTLTACVFERLCYLPDPLLGEILFASEIWRGDHDVAATPAELLKTDFWPRWPAYTEDSQKEPDCVLEFEERILVIEAKRYDLADQQRIDQLAEEWLAAKRHPELASKPIWLLAVGGLRDSRDSTVRALRENVLREIVLRGGPSMAEDFRFGAVQWSSLFSLTERCCSAEPHGSPQVERIVEDIRRGMLLHGMDVGPPVWLADLTLPIWSGCRNIGETSTHAFANRASDYWAEFRPVLSTPAAFPELA